jgi:AGCS family alanine or glycine:cation symporter
VLIQLIEGVYRLLWGDLLTLHLGNVTLSLSFMVILLLTAGVFFTLRTRLLPVRLFRDMLAAVCEKNDKGSGLSSFQTLVVSTATRVGMGNLVGVVAALSVGGAGAVFWMWVTALLGASTSFVESTLAQKYKQPDHLYGGWRGGPAYYLHTLAERKRGRKLRRSVVACLFAVAGLICWCGISQVVSNSVSEAFQNAFSIPPLVTTLVLTALAAVIVLRKEATVKSLDVMVPIMAGCYFVMTLWIILTHLPQLPGVFARIFSEALGLRQAVGGGFGAVVMNGIKRGLFSNEAGSGSAPCAAAAAECDDPVKMGLVQALGVLIDTIVICSCTAFVMLLAPGSVTGGLQGMDLLQAAMQYHLGSFGVVFIAVTLALFSFSTFIGILYYARCNVAYLFGDSWFWQTAYKVLALVMLVVGGMQAYTVVWDLGDVGIGLMTIFNMLALYPLSGEALTALREYEAKKKLK